MLVICCLLPRAGKTSLLSSEFEINDFGAPNKILGMELQETKNLLCYFFVSKVILRKFFIFLTGMLHFLLISTPIDPHFNPYTD
jgi:hypothetical protein